MKKTVLMFMALLMTLGLKAHVKPIVLGDKHAMLKVKQGEKYLLLPSYGLIPPNIPGATDGGTDFFKPSQNLVNAYRTGADGLPLLDTFNQKDYDMNVDNADPRLFLTVGMPGLPYMFNKNYMMDKTSIWSRSGGVYTASQKADTAAYWLPPSLSDDWFPVLGSGIG